jgi:5-methylcytosine-specific restriction endonuclease McrA
MKNYNDERWHDKRGKIKKRDNNTCADCGRSKATHPHLDFRVHHLRYLDPPAEIWDSPDEDLIKLPCVRDAMI